MSYPLYLLWTLHALRHGYKHGLPRYLKLRMNGGDSDHQQRIWVHAASVGEVRAVTPLVQALLQEGEKILFTSFTATGYLAIQNGFADSVSSSVIPFEHRWHCRRFFRRHRIRLALVVETELWPELMYQARKRDITLVLVNARLSAKSLQAGKYVRALLSTTLGYFERILVRNSKDRAALLSMGVSDDRIEITGNLKAYVTAKPQQPRLIDRDYLLLASSHKDEEQQFLQARPAELKHYLLVLAPRHPDRSAAIQSQIEALGMSFAVRSEAQTIDPDTEVYLADTLGELESLMAHARIVIMGGSFDTTGGHNLLEPAALGCAIITGASDSNIVEDIEMLGLDKGVLQVESMTACWQTITRLINHPQEALALGREARSRLEQQADIVHRYMAAIRSWL